MFKKLFRRRPAPASVPHPTIQARIAELTQERARVLASYDAAIGELQKLLAPATR
jgi:hypothetical protein